MAKLTNFLVLLWFIQVSAVKETDRRPLPTSAMSQPPIWAYSDHHRPPINLKITLIISIMFTLFVILAFFILCYRFVNRSRGPSIEDPDFGRQGSDRLPGLDPTIINKFPTFQFSTTKGYCLGNASPECAVCLGKFDDGETLRLLTRCRHVFHSDCIDEWFASHTTCPLCRANLDQQEDLGPNPVKLQDTHSLEQEVEPSPNDATECQGAALLNGSICSSSSDLERRSITRSGAVVSFSLRFPEEERVNGPQVNRCRSDMMLHSSMR